jgi:hypothetical protein
MADAVVTPHSFHIVSHTSLNSIERWPSAAAREQHSTAKNNIT